MLQIVKNYTGDRLHFGIAAEQAKAEGYQVLLGSAQQLHKVTRCKCNKQLQLTSDGLAIRRLRGCMVWTRPVANSVTSRSVYSTC